MKSSALALVTAAALMFGATSVSFAQEAERPASDAECAELATDGMEAPAAELEGEETLQDNESLSVQADEEDVDEADEGDAIDDQTPADCPPVTQ
jgi:hypothetical protein